MKKSKKQTAKDNSDQGLPAQLFGVPSSKQLITGVVTNPQTLVPPNVMNVADETQLLQSLGSDLAAHTSAAGDAITTVRNQYVTQDKQFATIALSPMASGSDMGREKNNMTGMFSNSSEPNSHML